MTLLPPLGLPALPRGMPMLCIVGLVCKSCGFEDPDQSAWLFAEDEGPIEPIVLAEKRRRKARRAGRVATHSKEPVDTRRSAD